MLLKKFSFLILLSSVSLNSSFLVFSQEINKKLSHYVSITALSIMYGIKEASLVIKDPVKGDYYYEVYVEPEKSSLYLLKESLELGLLPKEYLAKLPESVKSQLCSDLESSLYAYKDYNTAEGAYKDYNTATNKNLEKLIQFCRANY